MQYHKNDAKYFKNKTRRAGQKNITKMEWKTNAKGPEGT